MEIKLNNGLTVDINPDTEFRCERLWKDDLVKSILQIGSLCSDRKFNTSLVHAFIFKEYYAIVISNGSGIVREFHSTREIRQKRIRHLRYLRMKSKKE